MLPEHTLVGSGSCAMSQISMFQFLFMFSLETPLMAPGRARHCEISLRLLVLPQNLRVSRGCALGLGLFSRGSGHAGAAGTPEALGQTERQLHVGVLWRVLGCDTIPLVARPEVRHLPAPPHLNLSVCASLQH